MTSSPASTAAEHASLHADTAAALATWAHHAPGAAARALAALHRLLSATRAPLTGREWSGSRLTGDGYPLEFVFAFGSDRLRYTVDPVVTGCRPCDALRVAHELVGQIAPGAAAHLQDGSDAQAGAELRYGAWIGGAHDATRDHYKIYAEVPAPERTHQDTSAAGAEAAGHESGHHVAWPMREPAATLRMIGVDLTSGSVEYYWRTTRLGTHHLARALAAWGLRDRSTELLDFVERVYGHPLDGQVPGSPVGLSASIGPAGAPLAATLFVFARTLWGGDANIRRRLSALTMGTTASDAYHDVTAPLSSRDGYQTYHGMLGISVSRDAPLRLSVGVRPPPA